MIPIIGNNKKKRRANLRLLWALLFVFITFSPFRLVAQMQIFPGIGSDSTAKIVAPDTLISKRFGRAAMHLGLAETIPWIVDKYIRKADVYNASFNTLSHNIKPRSWAWDDDPVGTNQFGHPYQGSLFFSAFRANGYNFWQSAPAAFAGSYIWETAAETQPPAPNDFINTGFGGIVLGEMTYRLSNRIISYHARGVKRQVSEVLGFLINPMNGLNRILDGKWGKITGNAPERDSSKIYTEFDIGLRKFRINNTDGNFGLYGHMKLLYGTPYDNYKVPFSNILINAEFGKDDSSKVNTISVYGSLAGWPVRSGKNSRYLALLSANYDYINNEAFFYSGQSVKFNLYSEFTSGKFKISASTGGGPVLLAAVPDVYMFNGRPYDYCMGAGVNETLDASIAGHLFLGINYRGGWFKTVSGNASHYFLHAVNSEVSYRFANSVSLCAEPGYFSLKGDYNHRPNISKSYPYLRVSIRYSLDVQ